jgi:hypothetical protein
MRAGEDHTHTHAQALKRSKSKGKDLLFFADTTRVYRVKRYNNGPTCVLTGGLPRGPNCTAFLSEP